MIPTAESSEAREFLQTLREATSPFHRKLEALSMSTTLLSATATEEDYGQYLFALRPVIEFCERVIFPSAKALIPDISSRQKLEKIDLDLSNLHFIRTSAVDFTLFQEPVSPAEALGFLYVIEGSTLGGSVILRHLAKTNIPRLNECSHYFSVYGDGMGPMWKTFLADLTQFAITTHAQQLITAAASQTFKAIHDHFRQCEKIYEN